SIEGDLEETGMVSFYYNTSILQDSYEELIYSTFKEHFGIEQLRLINVVISQKEQLLNSVVKLILKVLPDGQLYFSISSHKSNGLEVIHMEGFIELDLVTNLESNSEKSIIQTQLNILNTQSEVINSDISNNSNSIDIKDERIAIIGMSGRYPKSKDLEVYWNNISKGVDCVEEVSKSRWDTTHYYKEGGEKTGELYCKWLGELDEIDKFDPLFFNMSPIEAELMDPQHRIFLEECWKSIEDAGYNTSQFDGMKCGTYVGIMGNEYADHIKKAGITQNLAQLMTGNSSSIFSSRLAYLLNLKGPAMAIDTACSSSLVAIHLACQALLSNEINMAVAGGVTLYLGVEPYEAMCAAGMLSKEGKCKTFDNSADGFVPGEGAGVVILKRLKDAIQDGDNIKGVILGSGINQDGKTNGITAPSVNSQISLLEDIYRKYGINPETISYVEAHGTGTKLGDPIEVEALIKAFGKFTKKESYCGIGSVKSNLGHTSAAAGVAGLEKILLQFKHRQIVPSLHY
ncbi:polyketide synthase, partial [Flavobacterium sp. H122]|uniref:beta-ketoacyl synthase N-terminal-like domain-containing protein n=1 Tax=Flavobacterium sp. H122 TaxID=2529860 RepID=UPI0010AA47DF